MWKIEYLRDALGDLKVTLPTTTQESIGELKTLFRKHLKVKSEAFTIGVSVGHANYPEDVTNTDQLITTADARMYLEKKINRIKKYPVRKVTAIAELKVGKNK